MSSKPQIKYLNTDLDLVSAESLTRLGEEFTSLGLYGNVAPGDDGLWFAMLEAGVDNDSPEQNTTQLLDAIDRLSQLSRDVLSRCSKFEFNIGYDCGDEPWAFNQGLSNEILKRIANYGATLRITLYPQHRNESP